MYENDGIKGNIISKFDYSKNLIISLGFISACSVGNPGTCNSMPVLAHCVYQNGTYFTGYLNKSAYGFKPYKHFLEINNVFCDPYLLD